MGKAALVERLKLAAAFYNNVGAGLLVAGMFVPLLNLMQAETTWQSLTRDLKEPPFRVFVALGIMCVASTLAWCLRDKADEIAKAIPD
jgi:formate/nitrite transporter FocA (FNT family)